MKNVVQLRQLLAERFPRSRNSVQHSTSPAFWSTGVAQLDDVLHGGLARRAITEVCNQGAGGALLIAALLRQANRANQCLALIDAVDSFDPGSVHPSELSVLLWVRCQYSHQ